MATGGTIAKLNVLIGANTRDFEKQLQSSERALRKWGRNMERVGSTLTRAVTLPILAVGGAAIKMASDAVESENLFNTAMGSMADAGRAFSEQLRKELGLNAYEVRKQLGTWYQMLDAMQLGEQRAYEMSEALTMLATDMASYRNLSIDEAFRKLQSGITGEIEPLRRLGILVDENTVRQIAMQKGLIETGQVLTAQEKVWLRYIAILEQTKNDQGDWAKTMNSPANQLRRLGNSVANLAIDLGVKLLPVFQQLVGVLQKIVSEVSKWVTAWAELPPWVQKTTIYLGLLAAATGPAILGLGKLAMSVSALSKALRGLVGAEALAFAATLSGWAAVAVTAAAGIAALVAGIKQLGTAAERSERKFREMGDALDAIEVPTEWVSRDAYAATINQLAELRARVQSEIEDVRAQLAAPVMTAPVVGGLAPAASMATQQSQQLRDRLAELERVAAATDAKMRQAAAGVGEFADQAQRIVDQGDIDQTITITTINRVITVSEPGKGGERPYVSGASGDPFAEEGAAFPRNAGMSAIPAPAIEFDDTWAKQWVYDFEKKSAPAVDEAGQWLKDEFAYIGSTMIDGLIRGTLDMGEVLKRFIIGFLSKFLMGPLFGALGISSPSKLFAEIGRDTFRGYIEGVQDMGTAVARAVVGVMPTDIELPAPRIAPIDVRAALEQVRALGAQVGQAVTGVLPTDMQLAAANLGPVAVEGVLGGSLAAEINPQMEVVVNVTAPMFADPVTAARDPQTQVFVREAVGRARQQGYR